MKQLPPPKREPFFAPGGLWTLAYVLTTLAVMFLFAEALGLVFTWLGR